MSDTGETKKVLEARTGLEWEKRGGDSSVSATTEYFCVMKGLGITATVFEHNSFGPYDEKWGARLRRDDSNFHADDGDDPVELVVGLLHDMKNDIKTLLTLN